MSPAVRRYAGKCLDDVGSICVVVVVVVVVQIQIQILYSPSFTRKVSRLPQTSRQ